MLDIATKLGVSVVTVSNALAGRDGVSEQMRKKICETAEKMGLGWNLGNSLESNPGSESSWGNPRTTQNTIRAVKARGFKTIRIPVTWYNHTDSNKTIDSACFK